MYGCYDLQRGDQDRDPTTNQTQRWAGTPGAAAQAPACPDDPGDGSLPEHVRQLQQDLRTLGFLIVGTPDGAFGRATEWAVREFQAYARMPNVARVRAGAPASARQGADVVAQLGQQGPRSVYVASLEQVANEAPYRGPVSGVVNGATRQALEHWLASDWRCPVVVEAWRTSGGRPSLLFQFEGRWAVNIWRHDEVASNAPRMFVRDFSGYYSFPTGHDPDEMIVLGDWVRFLDWNGPRSLPPNHTWPEGEILPEALTGASTLTPAQASTFRVVRAVSEVECLGFFDSVNAYDNAFMSVGPCHWTLGIVTARGDFSKGELCGYLAFLRHADPDTFAKAFEFFGTRVDENWIGPNTRPDGDRLFIDSQRKYVGWMAMQQDDGTFRRLAETESEGDYFKTWHWFYRFVMAGRTLAGYRRHMWTMARVRLRDLFDVRWGSGMVTIADGTPGGRAATIGDIFTSEKAAGIMLRWHIRFPADMIRGGEAGSRLRNALNEAETLAPNLAWDGDPTAWTDAHEAALIEGLRRAVALRNNENLSETINYVDEWPNWVGNNPRRYKLDPNMGPLSEARHSFVLDGSNLPPSPYTMLAPLPGASRPSPNQPEPSSDEPEPSPNEPEPSPNEPEPSPNEPEPSPDKPDGKKGCLGVLVLGLAGVIWLWSLIVG